MANGKTYARNVRRGWFSELERILWNMAKDMVLYGGRIGCMDRGIANMAMVLLFYS